MIEVEKKFLLTSDDTKGLLSGATFIKEYVMLDTYYDDTVYSLTIKDKWLRERNGKFELKLPMLSEKFSERLADQYSELETESEILVALGLATTKDFKKEIAAAGLKPFCSIKTTRRKYKREQFILDLDVVDFGKGDAEYTIAEIELMVPDKAGIPTAVATILDFARKKQLTIGAVRGKVFEYLKRYSPKHLEILVKSGMAG